MSNDHHNAVVAESTVQLFMELFNGSDLSHGVQVHKNGGVDHYTKEGPATPEDYVAHLAGKQGLGLVPIRPDGTCRFGGIDIDIDDINHALLYGKVQANKMPLAVCRSKSGGAHLDLFMKAPGVPATRVVSVLRRWAGILGFPQAEIFPKQVKVGKENRGNWLNLPYFDAENTIRYAFGPDGALTLEEFLNSVPYWNGQDEVTATTQLIVLSPDLPPCLRHFEGGGFTEPGRNEGMFNMCIYFRKAFRNGWQDQARQFNAKRNTPPLEIRELERIILSVEQHPEYNYRCDQPPIQSFCDRRQCLRLPFGVSGKLEVPEFRVSHLRKRASDPPTYTIEVNGQDLHLTSDEFHSFLKLRRRASEVLDKDLPRLRDDKWDEEVRKLRLTQETEEAPADASEEGMILGFIMDFLAQFKNSGQAEDILKGSPIDYRDDCIGFKSEDMLRYINLHKKPIPRVTPSRLWAILRRNGGTQLPHPAKIKGKSVRLWLFPKDKLNIQTEDFTPVSFDVTAEEM